MSPQGIVGVVNRPRRAAECYVTLLQCYTVVLQA